jgi:hypothetical protein
VTPIEVSKHDPTLSGIQNAEKLEKSVSSGDMEKLLLSNPVFNKLKEEVKRTEVHQNKVRGNRIDRYEKRLKLQFF